MACSCHYCDFKSTIGPNPLLPRLVSKLAGIEARFGLSHLELDNAQV